TFSFESETFTRTAEGLFGLYAVTWYGPPALTWPPVAQPVSNKSEEPADSKSNRQICRISGYWIRLDSILSTLPSAEPKSASLPETMQTVQSDSEDRKKGDFNREAFVDVSTEVISQFFQRTDPP